VETRKSLKAIPMKLLTNISPFLLLLIPIVVAALIVCVHVNKDFIHEQIDLNASFITIPEFLNVRALFF